MLCGADYGGEGAAEGVTCVVGEVGAGEEGLPSRAESRGSWGLQETPAAPPCGERCLMLVRYCTRLSVAGPRGCAPREEAELTGRTVDGACPERLPALML